MTDESTPAAPTPLPDVDSPLSLAAAHGELRFGSGLISGIAALALSVLALLGVITFHFPAYLSTPELRHVYDVTTIRYLLFASMVVAGGLALTNVVLGRARWLAATAFALLLLTLVLGGPNTPIADFPDGTPYIGLDFFILDLLGSTIVFVFIEKLFPLRRDQPTFRAEWQVDLIHFFVNHLVVGLTLLLVNRVVHSVAGWAVSTTVQGWIDATPFLVQLFLVFLVADLMQYWAHRAYHEVPFLWRIHSIHHSVKSMDWLAGSRQSLLELVGTRLLVLTPIFVLGFSQRAIDVYILVVGFQAVFDHANVSARMGPLRYVFVTPNFHHWHHSRDTEAIDKNYAAHFAFLDYLFGTAVSADRLWPDRYGVVGDYVPPGFVKQQLFPFIGSTESVEVERPTAPALSAVWEPPPPPATR